MTELGMTLLVQLLQVPVPVQVQELVQEQVLVQELVLAPEQAFL